jgi:DNA-binding NtrC family response regulator
VDIPELARHFLARFAAEEGKRRCRLNADALSLLRGYQWPGNVRQLENAIFRAVVLAETNTIGMDEFPQIAARAASAPPAATPVCPVAPGDEREPIESMAIGADRAPLEPFTATVPTGALDLLDAGGEVRPLEDIEADALRFAISHCRGQMSEVARRLRIGRSTLYRKLDSLGLAADSPDLDAPAL